MKYTPKEIPENVNVTKVHPVTNFGYLLATVVGLTVAIYFGLGLAVDWMVPRLSRETEVNIGDRLAPAVSLQLAGTEVETDGRIQYLDGLLAALGEPGDMTDLPLVVHLVDSDIVNAAALAGGHVFVTTAFLEAVESENELAFVLSHELGHLSARDSLRALGRSLLLVLGSTVLNLGTSGTSGTPTAVTATLNLQELHYSRKQELAADRYALSATVRRYGHGGNSLDFFERLKDQEGQTKGLQTVSEYFLTHPLTQKRIEALQQVAIEQGWSLEGSISPVPEGLNCPNFDCSSQ